MYARGAHNAEDFTAGAVSPTNPLSSVRKVHTTVYHVGALCTSIVARRTVVVKCGLKSLKGSRFLPPLKRVGFHPLRGAIVRRDGSGWTCRQRPAATTWSAGAVCSRRCPCCSRRSARRGACSC